MNTDIDDPMIETIQRLLKQELNKPYKIARFGDNLWIATDGQSLRKIYIGLRGETVLAKPLYTVTADM